MNNVLRGFLKEATAVGLAKTLAKPKNLMRALGVGMIAIPTALAAKAGAKKGRAGGQAERYLAASYDPISRRAMPSRAALTNYSPLFNRTPTTKQKKQISKHYKEKAFKG